LPKKNQSLFGNFVECYYDSKINTPILIYKGPNGKIIDELKPLKETNCWYKFAISESKDGWLKIENLIILPSCRDNILNKNIEKYKGKWVLAKNIKISIADLDMKNGNGVKFFKKPNLKSEIIYISGKFLEAELIEINELWAKVSFLTNNKTTKGWLQRKDQCAYPWTSCPYIED